MLSFWSLGRSGLLPVSGRPSFRAFVAAVRSCGLPVPSVGFELEAPGFGPLDGRRLLLVARLSFSSGPLFRCWFAASRLVSPRSLWVRTWFALLWLWLLPIRVTEYRECPCFPAPSRWVAFVDALRAPPSLYLP